MKIAIAADHRGQAAKEKIAVLLSEQGHQILDMGTNSSKSCDYPDMAYAAARAVADGQVERAIMVCGSGIGMTICANKVPNVRAALCHDELTAQMSRRHNDANVLCLASDV
ncbi:MAG: RpiB/LacA/LacB family sugar-phosphate isomerase, partial [Planctomycetota bacterium]